MSATTVYLACFGVGLALTVLSVVGAGHLHLHGVRLHVGHHGAGAHGVGGHGLRGGAGWMAALNGSTLAAFLCWFGGIGYLLTERHHMLALTVALLALAAGMCGAAVVGWFLVRVLLPGERTLEPEDTEMRGVLGRATSGFGGAEVGEVLFSQNGTRRAVAARADGGERIARGAEVVVTRYERGVAVVRPFAGLGEEARWQALGGDAGLGVGERGEAMARMDERLD